MATAEFNINENGLLQRLQDAYDFKPGRGKVTSVSATPSQSLNDLDYVEVTVRIALGAGTLKGFIED